MVLKQGMRNVFRILVKTKHWEPIFRQSHDNYVQYQRKNPPHSSANIRTEWRYTTSSPMCHMGHCMEKFTFLLAGKPLLETGRF